jgi:hypothetical protein
MSLPNYPDRVLDTVEEEMKYVPSSLLSVGGIIQRAAVPWDSVFGLDLAVQGTTDLSVLDERFEIAWWCNEAEGLTRGIIIDTTSNRYCNVHIIKVGTEGLPAKDIPPTDWIIEVDHRVWYHMGSV